MEIKRETLSAVMDGDDALVTAVNLDQIASSDEARATWARYHLISDVLRDHSIPDFGQGFAARVSEQLASEATVLAPRRQRRFSRRAGGLALAASVATMAVIGVRQMNSPPASSPEGVSVAVQDTTSIVAQRPVFAEVPSIRATLAASTPIKLLPTVRALDSIRDANAPRNLNRYLVKFNAQRASLGIPSVNPHVRIVGFDRQ